MMENLIKSEKCPGDGSQMFRTPNNGHAGEV